VRATVGLGAVHAASALVATGLIIASHGLLAGFLVAVALVAGRFLGALAAALFGGARPSAFALTAAVASLGAIAFAAFGFAAVGSGTVTVSITAGVAALAIGALTDVARQPSGPGGPGLIRLANSLGILAGLAATLVTAGHARAVEWRHGGLDGILIATAVLVVVAVAVGRPARPEAGPMIARGRMGPGFGGALRTACANMRWYPVIPLIGAVIVANALGVLAVFVAWMGVLLKGRDRAEEIRELLMRPTGVGQFEPSITSRDPEFHTGRDGVGDHGQHQYQVPGSNQFPDFGG